MDMKYMGSKSRIAKDIVPIIQSYIDNSRIVETYWEPFVGGANIIDKIKCQYRIGSDLNKYLIALLCHVRDGGELYESVTKETYDAARDVFNTGDNIGFKDWQIGNIGFLASYNGRFFDGGYAKPGYEKTKNGLRYRDYYKEALNNLLEQAPKLKEIDFIVSDYRKLEPHNCVVYCDPPYSNTKQYKNAINFDYDEFWYYAAKWAKNNIVLVSELEAPEGWECIWEKNVNRSINTANKANAIEKLFIRRD